MRRIKELGMKRYKERLLQQLDFDCNKKLFVVYSLFFLCTAIMAFFSFSGLEMSFSIQALFE